MSKHDRIINEVWSAITHGIGVMLSISGLVMLIIKSAQAGSVRQPVAFSNYGTTLIGLFLFSTLFHSLFFTRAKRVFQVFDHCGIYLLIVGTYTPFCLLAISGLRGWIMLAVIWLLAIGGIVYHIACHNRSQKLETAIYVLMGWLCLMESKQLFAALGVNGIILLVLGGVFFTVGALVYSSHLWKYNHVLWHLFVIMGAASMFCSLYFYI